MKVPTFALGFLVPVAICQGATPAGAELLDVLGGDPETQEFGKLLGEHPDLLGNLDLTKNYTVFAPPNAAVIAFRQSFGINGSYVARYGKLHRRGLAEYAAAIALLFTDKSNQANLNTEPTNLITNLTDPAFINIVPAPASASLTESSTPLPTSTSTEPIIGISAFSTSGPPSVPTFEPILTVYTSVQLRLRQDPSSDIPPPPASTEPPSPPPDEGSGNANCPSIDIAPLRKRSTSPYSPLFRRQIGGSGIMVSSGFGEVSEASLSEVPFKSGGVRKVDSFFTLFGELSETLLKTNGTAFANALVRAGALDSLSRTSRVTIFVPNDAALQGQTLDESTLKQYVILNTLGTSPQLKTGSLQTSAGNFVNVTSNPDGSISINNATITKADVMIKNGVIHYLDKAYTDTSTSSAPGLNIPVAALIIALLASSLSMF